MSSFGHIIDMCSGALTVYVSGKPHSISNDHCNYDEIMKRLVEKDYDGIEDLLDIPLAVAHASDGKVVIEGNEIYYNGAKIHNVLVDRILDFMKKGWPFESLVLFLENLLQNPNKDTIEELYLFLESGHIPITDDGCFLAYKKVDDELKSYHASPDGSHLYHEIGSIVSMPRDEVDTNRHRTCSVGLHFCSLSYLSQYAGGNGRVIILKINPRDVCAIPSDYSNAKGRASQYVVMEEYDHENRESEDAYKDSYVPVDKVRESMHHVEPEPEPVCADSCNDCDCDDSCDVDNGWGVKPSGQKYNNLRDENGRFRKRS